MNETCRRALVLVVAFAGLPASGAAQVPLPQVFAGAPAAPWIFPPGAPGDEFGVFHFRRVFELDARPSSVSSSTCRPTTATGCS